MSSQASKSSGVFGVVFNVAAIVIALVASYFIWKDIMGNPVNFEGGNPEGHPLPGNYLAIIYKGGYIVPLLISCILILLTFSIERAITLSRAKGKGRLNVFVRNIQTAIAANQIEESQAA
jgi:biopolymer transport protein ExbB